MSLEHEFTEILDNIASNQAQPQPQKPRQPRQGLPAEYRMRHDAHYVDELTTRASTPPEEPESPQLQPVSVPAVLHDLCREFEGLASCFNLLEQSARPLRERMGLSLAKIGAQRSVRTAQQLRVLIDEWRPAAREIRLDQVVRQACDEFREELRLVEATLAIDLPASALTIKADPALVATAITACTGATLALIEAGGKPAELQVSVFRADEMTHCEFRQEACVMDSKPPRGISTALMAASRVAQLHGGKLEARRTTLGSAFLLSLP